MRDRTVLKKCRRRPILIENRSLSAWRRTSSHFFNVRSTLIKDVDPLTVDNSSLSLSFSLRAVINGQWAWRIYRQLITFTSGCARLIRDSACATRSEVNVTVLSSCATVIQSCDIGLRTETTFAIKFRANVRCLSHQAQSQDWTLSLPHPHPVEFFDGNGQWGEGDWRLRV